MCNDDNNQDPNAADNCFLERFIEIHDNCFPLQKINLKNKNTLRKPWMTKGLVRSCIKKAKLFRQFKLNQVFVIGLNTIYIYIYKQTSEIT